MFLNRTYTYRKEQCEPRTSVNLATPKKSHYSELTRSCRKLVVAYATINHRRKLVGVIVVGSKARRYNSSGVENSSEFPTAVPRITVVVASELAERVTASGCRRGLPQSLSTLMLKPKLLFFEGDFLITAALVSFSNRR